MEVCRLSVEKRYGMGLLCVVVSAEQTDQTEVLVLGTFGGCPVRGFLPPFFFLNLIMVLSCLPDSEG